MYHQSVARSILWLDDSGCPLLLNVRLTTLPGEPINVTDACAYGTIACKPTENKDGTEIPRTTITAT
jgi:hypothetical protein